MSDDAKKKDGDASLSRTDEVRKLESANLANQIKIDPKLLKEVSTPTNAHSGSAGGDQDESIGIDFGNGHVASRQNKLTEASAPPLPSPKPIHYEKPPLPSPVLPQNRDILSAAVLKLNPSTAQIQPPNQADSTANKPTDIPGVPKPNFSFQKVEVSNAHPQPLLQPMLNPAPELHPQPMLPKAQESLSQSPLAKTPDSPLAQQSHPVAESLVAQKFPETPVPEQRPGQAPEVHSTTDHAPSPEAGVFAASNLIDKRTELESVVQQKITNPKEREQFLSDMRKFEDDFDSRSSKSEVDKKLEMARTYAQVSRLLSADNDVLSRYSQCKQAPGETPWRVQAAEQIMHQAAEPTSVDQGVLAVCPTAALQVRQYWRDPSAVAKLVTDVLLTGSYTATTRDKRVDLTQCPDNLIPDVYARRFSIEKQISGEPIHLWKRTYTGVRSFASQIFDVAATNMVLSGKGYRFEQPPYQIAENNRQASQGVAVSKAGERLAWNLAIERQISVQDRELVTLNQQITGKRETGFLVVGAPLSEVEGKDRNFRKFLEFSNRETNPRFLYSSTELGKVLTTVQESNQWPPIASVNTSTKPFDIEKGGSHYITVTGLSGDTRKLAFDNTWGRDKDRNGIPSEDIEEFAGSIRFEAARRGFNAGALMPLIHFQQNNRSHWTNLVQSWVGLSEMVKNAPNPETAIAEHNKAMQDTILKDWMAEHPGDRNLKLWHTTLLEWLAKYPEELKSQTEKR